MPDMGTLVVTEFLTLDGVAQAPGGPDEDVDGGFPHGGWQAPLIDRESGEAIYEQAKGMDALLLGRRTYEIFARYWPSAPEDMPFTSLMNRVPKYVASRAPVEPLAWHGSTRLTGDLASSVPTLKEQHEQINVIGSLDLTQSLLSAGLVDRLHLWVHPVVLGSGKRLFGAGTTPMTLRLAESVTYATGVVQLVYANAGAPRYGDMAVDTDELRPPAGSGD